MEANLSMEDFAKYFENDRLGKLFFPNGGCIVDGEDIMTSFNIRLRELYKLVTGLKINDTEVPLDDIVGVIAFGSAVRWPGFESRISRIRKYLFFGPEIIRKSLIPIQPNNADFLVITRKNLAREDALEPATLLNSYGTLIKEGGIRIINRGIEHVVNGIQKNDNVSVSAMREGVPIFYNGILNEIIERTGIKNETPRKVNWYEDRCEYLFGIIENGDRFIN